MKEMEKNVMCVLLQRLLDKELITPDIHDKAITKILDTSLDGPEFFCCGNEDRKGKIHGYTQNPL